MAKTKLRAKTPPSAPDQEVLEADQGPGDRAPMRRCIVTRSARPTSELIRFVRTPDGAVVGDLKRRLPGRGVWVTARRWAVMDAVRRKLFGRGLRADVKAGPELADEIGARLKEAALGALGLERRAGRLSIGFAEVETLLRRGKAVLALHAVEAAADGVRKLDQAAHAGGRAPYVCRAFTAAELSLALGRPNVIHAGLENTRAGDSAAERCRAYELYLDDRVPVGDTGTENRLGQTE